MIFFIFLQIINIFCLFECNNIVLPFKKLTIGSFKNDKTINDLISYNIFTTIEIGDRPSQLVGFFLEQNEISFSFRKRLLSFNSSKSKEIMKLYQKLPNFWFDIHKSSEIYNCDLEQFCSELFHFNTFTNSKIETNKFKFNIYSDFMNEKGDLYGYKTNGSNPILIDYCNTDKSHNSWNVACFGKKGGGKTTFIQKIALNFFCNPRFRKIFFIDYENEYTQMTKNFNGDVIDLSGLKKNGGRINPFEIFATSNDEDDNKTHDL